MGAILCNEGLILLVIGIVGVIESIRLNRISAAADEAFGPGWYLLILSLILIICGFYYLASTFKRVNKKTEAAHFLEWTGCFLHSCYDFLQLPDPLYWILY